jgi:tricorn protease-like protein
VRSLDTGHTVTILPPAVVKDKSILGSARFSPDGSRLAFAGAKGDPDAEQGWLAVSDGLGSSSSLIITSEPGQYFTVLGWLNDSTLLVQTNTSMAAQPMHQYGLLRRLSQNGGGRHVRIPCGWIYAVNYNLIYSLNRYLHADVHPYPQRLHPKPASALSARPHRG